MIVLCKHKGSHRNKRGGLKSTVLYSFHPERAMSVLLKNGYNDFKMFALFAPEGKEIGNLLEYSGQVQDVPQPPSTGLVCIGLCVQPSPPLQPIPTLIKEIGKLKAAFCFRKHIIEVR